MRNPYSISLASALMLGITNLSLAAPAPIITSTFDKSASGESSFGIGFTSSIAKRPFINVENQNTTLPYLSLRLGDFYVEGVDTGYNLGFAHNFRLDALATPRFYERKPGYARGGELDNLEATGETYLAGLSAQYHSDYGALTSQLLYDAIESEGFEAVIQFSKTFDTTKTLKLTPSFGLSWQNATMIDHFYGVPPESVTAERAAYDGQSSLNTNITFNASWLLFNHLEILGQLKYEWIGDGITDSSIVDEDQLYFFTLGAVYRF